MVLISLPINRRVSYSQASQDKYLFLRECEANEGQFSPRRRTNMKKLRLSCRKKGKFETYVERFWRSQNILTGLRNHWFKQQKENQLVITKKNNEPNQKLTEIVVGAGAELHEKAKMVSKSLKKGSYFNFIFSDG